MAIVTRQSTPDQMEIIFRRLLVPEPPAVERLFQRLVAETKV